MSDGRKSGPSDATDPRAKKPGSTLRFAAELGAVFASYTAIALWWLWPLPTVWATDVGYVADKSPLILADVYLIVWALAWGAHALMTDPAGLFEANAFYPSNLSLAYSEHFLGYQVLFAPLYWMTANPVLATNLVILLTYPLCGVAVYALARRFVPAPAAWLGGFFFAFFPWRLARLAHLHLLGVQYMALALLFAERWLERARTRDALLLAVCLTLQALSSFYLAYALAAAMAAYAVCALWRWRDRLDRRRIIGLAAGGGAAMLALGLSSLPYLSLRRAGLIPSYGVEDPATMSLVPAMTAAAVRRVLGEQGMGAVGYGLALLAIFPGWCRGRGLRAIGGALVVAGVILAYGPSIPVAGHEIWSPYRLLRSWVPGFAAVRVPERFLVVAQLGFALLAGIGAAQLGALVRAGLSRIGVEPPAASSLRLLGWSGALLLGLVALLRYPLPSTLELEHAGGEDAVGAAYRWLAMNGEQKPLLEIPNVGPREAAHRMFLSTTHWLPIIGGYSGYPPKAMVYLYRLARGLPEEGAFVRLTDTIDVGWILVHRDRLTAEERARWDGPLPAGMERAGEWGDDLLLRVTRPSPPDARARLLDGRASLGGVPLEPLGDDCRGKIDLIGIPPEPWAAAEPVLLRVSIENGSGRAWPGLAFVARNLVQVGACIGMQGPRPCEPRSFPLLADVPAPGKIELDVPLMAPLLEGTYDLRIELLQAGVGSLARCGVEPLVRPVQVRERLKNGPPGSYWKSCHGCVWDGQELRCACLDERGSYATTTGRGPCPAGFANRNGQLDCEG